IMEKRFNLIFANIGLTSIITQIIYLRELIVVFYGNELSIGIILGFWLFWTAIGSLLAGRFASKIKESITFLSYLILFNIFIIPLSIVIIRSSKSFFNISTGEITGLFPILITSFFLLSPFCFISGSIFSFCSAILSGFKKEKPEISIGKVYFWEGLGAGIGGLISNFILIKHLNSIQISFLLSSLNLVIFLLLKIRGSIKYKDIFKISVSGIIFFLLSFTFSRKIENFSNNILWKNFKLQEVKNTIYGNIAVTSFDNQYNFFENGLFVFSTKDELSAEESIHFPLLEHPKPENILLIGGGINGSIKQLIKYPTIVNIDYIELDPEIIRLGKKYNPDLKKVLSNKKISIYNVDGRFFINQSNKKYDIIVVNLPDPYTIQLNRFYTREFFRKVKERLNETGIFSFSLTSSENVIGNILSEFLSIIYTSLRQEFPETIVIPGNTNHFISCNKKGILTENYNILISRLKNRNIKTNYISEFYLPYRMAEERIDYLKTRVKENESLSANLDFKPLAYYYDLILWSTKFSKNFKSLFLALVKINKLIYYFLISGIFIFLIVFFSISKKQVEIGIPFSVAVVGFTEIALEIIIILGFQIIYGYIYSKISILLASFMIGLCAGSYSALFLFKRKNDVFKIFIQIQAFIVIIPVIILLFFSGILKLNARLFTIISSEFIFPLLTVLCGFLGGLHFTLSNRIFFSQKVNINWGIIYSVDLAGSFLGAILISSFIIPIIGIYKSCYFISVINIIVLIILLIIKRRI
ncbi:hypothetical protein DRQ09_04995, partial [candidate division KSB1 bacterium]